MLSQERDVQKNENRQTASYNNIKTKNSTPNCSTVTVSEKGRESQTTASQTDHLHRLADQRATVPRCVPVSSTGHVHTTEGEGIGFFLTIPFAFQWPASFRVEAPKQRRRLSVGLMVRPTACVKTHQSAPKPREIAQSKVKPKKLQERLIKHDSVTWWQGGYTPRSGIRWSLQPVGNGQNAANEWQQFWRNISHTNLRSDPSHSALGTVR